jgi:hypothetical protein
MKDQLQNNIERHTLRSERKTAGNSGYTRCKNLVELPFRIELFT